MDGQKNSTFSRNLAGTWRNLDLSEAATLAVLPHDKYFARGAMKGRGRKSGDFGPLARAMRRRRNEPYDMHGEWREAGTRAVTEGRARTARKWIGVRNLGSRRFNSRQSGGKHLQIDHPGGQKVVTFARSEGGGALRPPGAGSCSSEISVRILKNYLHTRT